MNKRRVGRRFMRFFSLLLALCMLLSSTNALSECSHANTYTEKTFGGYGEDHSPSEHLVFYEIYIYCKDCGEEIGCDYPEEWLPHSVVNGACACGYSDDFPCGHPVREDGPSYIEYESISSREHIIYEWTDVLCGICGDVCDVWGSELGTEVHTFGSNGLCTKCGYQRQKATEFCSRCNEMRTWTDYTDQTLYSQMADGRHAKWFGTVEKCDHCGYTVRKKMYDQVFEDHVFVNGKCVCGAKGTSEGPDEAPAPAPCDHGGTTVYDRVDKFSYTYSRYNSNQHIKRTKDQVFCPCGEMVYENNWESYEPHTMSGGKCTLCGYEKGPGTGTSTPSDTNTPSSNDTLSKGNVYNKPSKVKELQNLLMQSGYPLPRYGADGDFGSETENAVKQFQADHGLPVTGIVDEETWNRLLSPDEPEKIATPAEAEPVAIPENPAPIATPEEPSEEEHEHIFVDDICAECGLFDRNACVHIYSMPYRTNGAMKYYRCVLCQNELLIVSRMPTSFEEDLKTFAEEAAIKGTDSNKAYENILDVSNKTAFGNLFSSIIDQYKEKGIAETSTENLYRFLGDIPGYAVSAITNEDDFEKTFDMQLELSIKRALIQQNQNDLINTNDAKQRQKVVDTASAAAGEFLKMALDGKNAKALEKVELVGDWSGYGLAAMGLAVKTADIVNMTYGQIAMLGSLVSEYEYNMTMLDAMIDECGKNSAIGQACQRIKNDMDHQFIASCRDISKAHLDITGETLEAASLFLFDKVVSRIADSDTLKILNLKVSKDGVKIVSKTIGNPAFLKTFSGVMSGMMLGGKVGALLTDNAGVMLDAKEEILITSTMEALVRDSVQDAYDDQSAALKPLTQLWTIVQMDGLNASEKYIKAYEKEVTKHAGKEKLSFEEFIFRVVPRGIKESVTGTFGYYVLDNIEDGAKLTESVFVELVFGDLDQRNTDIHNIKLSLEEDKRDLKEIAENMRISFGMSLLPDIVLTSDQAIPAGDYAGDISMVEYVPYTLYIYQEPKAETNLLVNIVEVSENGLWLPYEEVCQFVSNGRFWIEAQYGENKIYITRDNKMFLDEEMIWTIRTE